MKLKLQPQNTLVIISDEHNKKILGCYGNRIVQTPNLDGLAESGTRFTAAYTPSPICVPARASLATGRYVNRIRCWDNAIAYAGQPESWGHKLMAAGRTVSSIGKLHYSTAGAARNGFDEEILPMHILNGEGDLLGLIRDDLAPRKGTMLLGPEAGPGESEYTAYDRAITDEAIAWLHRASKSSSEPWTLYVGFVAPHFPLIAPEEFFNIYANLELPLPKLYREDQRPDHPFIKAMRNCLVHDKGFDGPQMVRKALAAYFGLVSFLDSNIGKILAALRESGLHDSTRIIYSSDHGDNLGARGMWAKSTMYEESAGIPLIIAGRDIAVGAKCEAPVSLVDLYPTILESVGHVDASHEEPAIDGFSLFKTMAGLSRPKPVLSEYHALAAIAATYMIRFEQFKYIYYVGLPPMLFDLKADPEELCDLGTDPTYQSVVAKCETALNSLVSPELTDLEARADQQAKLSEFGGRDSVMQREALRYSPPPSENLKQHPD